MAKKRGYFILYRDIYSSPVFKNLLQASCWIYFISSASHRDVTLKFLDSEDSVNRKNITNNFRKRLNIRPYTHMVPTFKLT